MQPTMGAAAGVDVGGTFTDVVLVRADRPPVVRKVPTTPDDQGEGVAAGLAAATDGAVSSLAHGTTAATNAILERAVARTVLVTTAGFRDLLVIGRQHRPSLYDLAVIRPAPIVARDDVVTVTERTGPAGEAVVALTDAEVARTVEAVAAREPEAVAVCLLFAYAGPAHERRLATAIAEALEVPVSVSSALIPEFREYERASTCALNAAVAPVMRRYLSGLSSRVPEATITVMTSGGGTAAVERAATEPVHTLLSGPAAGVVAAGAVARSAGFADAVAFDMGGTSTDVCLVRGGVPEIANEGHIDGLPFRVPAVAVHTVGAGGGSIAWVDTGGALRVGPRSAGAVPGPACYGRGGQEPTVTDAHAVLGHLDPEGALGGGRLDLDVGAAQAAFGRLPGAHADGVHTVVRATMARALRRVTTEQGVDPSDLALVAYGGAGPLHATALARELGSRAVVVPPVAGVLSALGLLLAPPRAEASRTVMAGAGGDLGAVWADLEDAARADLAAQGLAGGVTVERVADCRYQGQSHELRVPAEPGTDLAHAFHVAHATAYGYQIDTEQVQVVTVRAIATGEPVLPGVPAAWDLAPVRRRPDRRVTIDGATATVPVIDRAHLSPGDLVEGPAIVEQADATTLLAGNDRGVVDQAGNLVIQVEA